MVVLCLATSHGWVCVDYSGRWPCGWPSERFAWCVSNVQSWIIEPVRWLGFLCNHFPSDKLERHIWQASNPSKTWATTHPNNNEGLQLDWLLISLFQRLKPIRGRDFNEVLQEKHAQSHGPSDLPPALAWVSVVFNWIKWRPETGASSYLSTTAVYREKLGRGKQRVWTMVVFRKNKQEKTDRVYWGKLIKMIFWNLH